MQLTNFQIIDVALEILLFVFPFLVLLDFIRVLPSIIRVSWVEAQTGLLQQESSLAKDSVTKPNKSPRRRTSKAIQMELLPDEMVPTVTSEPSATRLTFKKVCADFANKGFILNRFPSSRYRYRVGGLPHCRFKKLEQAIDWLDGQPEPLEIPKHHQLELLDTVMV
jgi:hypothetical protein